jgi:hypothetical protein
MLGGNVVSGAGGLVGQDDLIGKEHETRKIVKITAGITFFSIFPQWARQQTSCASLFSIHSNLSKVLQPLTDLLSQLHILS